MPRYPPTPPMRVTVLVAHRFADGKRSARLYLLDGETPTEEHTRNLDRAMRDL